MRRSGAEIDVAVEVHVEVFTPGNPIGHIRGPTARAVTGPVACPVTSCRALLSSWAMEQLDSA